MRFELFQWAGLIFAFHIFALFLFLFFSCACARRNGRLCFFFLFHLTGSVRHGQKHDGLQYAICCMSTVLILSAGNARNHFTQLGCQQPVGAADGSGSHWWEPRMEAVPTGRSPGRKRHRPPEPRSPRPTAALAARRHRTDPRPRHRRPAHTPSPPPPTPTDLRPR